MANVFFKDVNNVPPGGMYFYETHGERVTGRTFLEIKPKVMALMEKYGIPGLAEQAVAEYMCPLIPNAGAYCRGNNVKAEHVRPHEALNNSLPYCDMQDRAQDAGLHDVPKACQGLVPDVFRPRVHDAQGVR